MNIANEILPARLSNAESDMFKAILHSLKHNSNNYLSVKLRFEGIKLGRVVKNLSDSLINEKQTFIQLWSDAGGTALAKRDNPDISQYIYSYSEYIRNDNIDRNSILIAPAPQPYDIDEFKQVCEKHLSKIIIINGKLEDTAIGIGSVGREIRKNFLSLWDNIYWLEPLTNGAIMRVYPGKWLVYKLYDDGFRFKKEFDNKPNEEEIIEILEYE